MTTSAAQSNRRHAVDKDVNCLSSSSIMRVMRTSWRLCCYPRFITFRAGARSRSRCSTPRRHLTVVAIGDQESPSAALHLHRVPTAVTGDRWRAFPRGLGNDRSKRLANRFLQPDISCSLEGISFRAGDSTQVSPNSNVRVVSGDLPHLIKEIPRGWIVKRE